MAKTFNTKAPAGLSASDYEERRLALAAHVERLRKAGKQREAQINAQLAAARQETDDAIAAASSSVEARAQELSESIADEFHKAAAEAIRHQTEQPARGNAAKIHAAWMRVVDRCRSELHETASNSLIVAAFVGALHETPARCAAVFGADSFIRSTPEAVRAVEVATGCGPALDDALAFLEASIRAVMPTTRKPPPVDVERFKLRSSIASARRLHIAEADLNARAQVAAQAKWAEKHNAEMAAHRESDPRRAPRIL